MLRGGGVYGIRRYSGKATHPESDIVTRSIIGLVVGAVLGAVLGAIFGLVLYVIFGWLLSGVTTFLGLNILQTLAGLNIGCVIGSLFGAIAGLIFIGSVNIAEVVTARKKSGSKA